MQTWLSDKAFEDSPDRPLFIRNTDGAGSQICANTASTVPFETELFEGNLLVYVAGLPSSPAGLFKHQKRRSYVVIQGRFKEAVPLNDVLTGQLFQRPLRNLPPPWLLNALCRVARHLSPSLTINAHSLLSPLAATAQVVHVATSGAQPAISGPPLEDLRLCGPLFESPTLGSPLPMSQRRRLFATARDRTAELRASPQHVYTFWLWQHLLDLGQLQLATPVGRFSLAAHLDGQPLSVLACMQGGRRLWDFQIWHEALLPAACEHHKRLAFGEHLNGTGADHTRREC